MNEFIPNSNDSIVVFGTTNDSVQSDTRQFIINDYLFEIKLINNK